MGSEYGAVFPAWLATFVAFCLGLILGGVQLAKTRWKRPGDLLVLATAPLAALSLVVSFLAAASNSNFMHGLTLAAASFLIGLFPALVLWRFGRALSGITFLAYLMLTVPGAILRIKSGLELDRSIRFCESIIPDLVAIKEQDGCFPVVLPTQPNMSLPPFFDPQHTYSPYGGLCGQDFAFTLYDPHGLYRPVHRYWYSDRSWGFSSS